MFHFNLPLAKFLTAVVLSPSNNTIQLSNYHSYNSKNTKVTQIQQIRTKKTLIFSNIFTCCLSSNSSFKWTIYAHFELIFFKTFKVPHSKSHIYAVNFEDSEDQKLLSITEKQLYRSSQTCINSTEAGEVKAKNADCIVPSL